PHVRRQSPSPLQIASSYSRKNTLSSSVVSRRSTGVTNRIPHHHHLTHNSIISIGGSGKLTITEGHNPINSGDDDQGVKWSLRGQNDSGSMHLTVTSAKGSSALLGKQQN